MSKVPKVAACAPELGEAALHVGEPVAHQFAYVRAGWFAAVADPENLSDLAQRQPAGGRRARSARCQSREPLLARLVLVAAVAGGIAVASVRRVTAASLLGLATVVAAAGALDRRRRRRCGSPLDQADEADTG